MGMARQKLANEAARWFQRLESRGLQPDESSLKALVAAHVGAGEVKRAEELYSHHTQPGQKQIVPTEDLKAIIKYARRE